MLKKLNPVTVTLIALAIVLVSGLIGLLFQNTNQAEGLSYGIIGLCVGSGIAVLFVIGVAFAKMLQSDEV